VAKPKIGTLIIQNGRPPQKPAKPVEIL